jgi:hypothetical protein
VNEVPSRGRVLREAAIAGLAYLIGLALLLFVDLPPGRMPSLLVGATAFLVVYTTLGWLMLGWRPSFRRNAPLGRRPWRYSIPNAVALVAAIIWLWSATAATTPDVAVYGVAVPLLIAGQLVSNLWWASAAPRTT